MFPTKLAGTVDAYVRHVVLFYKSSEDLAARVEGSGSDPLRKLLSSAVKARKRVDVSVKTKVTVCEGREGTDFADGDVLILPDMIKYRGLKESDVDSFVDDVIVNGKPWASGAQEVFTDSHVFVHAHGSRESRDCRCGVCGPVLVEEADLRGLKDQIFDSPCSHIGGHKYAGNLIIYSPGADGMITGHWYGCVARHDVPELIDGHIGTGQIIERQWRGQMGESAEEAENASENKLLADLFYSLWMAQRSRLPNGEEPGESAEETENASENKLLADLFYSLWMAQRSRLPNGEEPGESAEEAENASENKLLADLFYSLWMAHRSRLPNGEEPKESKEKPQENFSGCCQGANRVSCCRDGSLEQSSGIEEKKQKETTEDTSGKKSSVEQSKKMKFEVKHSCFKQVHEEKGSNAQVIETKRKFEEVKSSVEQSKKMKFEEKQGWPVPPNWLQIGMNQRVTECVEADQEVWVMREGQMPVGNDVDGLRVSNISSSLRSMMSIDNSLRSSGASMMSIDPSGASMMSIDPSEASMMSIDASIGSNNPDPLPTQLLTSYNV